MEGKIMNVYEKLMTVQTKLRAPKGQYNSFGKYSYRSCEDILEALKPLLAEVGAIVNVSDEIKLIGDRFYVEATASFIDVETGERMIAKASAREAETKKGRVVIMDVTFKYKIGQLVYYNNHLYRVLSRAYFETKDVSVNKYNLRSVDDHSINGYEPNVWEDDIKTLWRVK